MHKVIFHTFPCKHQNGTMFCKSNYECVLIVPPSPVDAEPVAFYSYIALDTTHKLQMHQTLIYDTVKLNKGNGYHSDDGIFIVPRTGIYAFAWTQGVSNIGWATTEIAINGQTYGRAFADGDQATDDVGFGTGFVIAEVNAGDHVYIRMHDTGFPVLFGYGVTSFSGWKLY